MAFVHSSAAFPAHFPGLERSISAASSSTVVLIFDRKVGHKTSLFALVSGRVKFTHHVERGVKVRFAKSKL